MSSNGQPPLTRRQVRDLERAREAGEAITGSISVVSGSPVPSAMPVTSPSPAPASSTAPASSSAPASSQAPGSVQAPGSAHTPTRRELRAQREASAPADASPVPLRAPKPEHERNLSDALSHVADIENGRAAAIVPPREARRTVAPAPDEDFDDADDREVAGLPSPVSAGRDTRVGDVSADAEASLAAAADQSPVDEVASGTRRHGAAPDSASSPESDLTVGQRIASSTPPPSSTPTVFPFALGSASTPEPSSAPSVPVSAVPLSSAPSTSAPSVASPSAASAVAAEPATADPAPVAAPVSAPAAPVAEAAVVSSTPEPQAAGPVQAPAAAAPAAAAPAEQAPVAQAAPAPRQQAPIPASVPEPSGYVPPTGHWSTQADLEDDTIESVGSHFGSMTSTGQHNALIIGNDQLPDVTGALNATGEVIITGSIDLPRSLAATGSHHAQRIDGSDIDRMLEEGDREQPDSDASPVRASRAVSANTSTRAVVLTAGAQKSNRLPIVATIIGGAVFIVIVGLVVVGFATHVL